MNYNLSVCLTDLDGAQVVANPQGQQFVQIPIQQADLFLTDKGKVYLNLSMWAKKNGVDQYGKSHGIKQSLSQARREALGEAAKNTPFIGAAKEMPPKNANGQPQQQNQAVYQQTAPQGYAQPYQPQPQNNMYPQGAQPYNPNPTSDIPF